MIVVDTTDPAFSRDPHEILRDARRRSPIAFDTFGTPMLLRYADIDAALKDPRFVNDYDVLLTRHGITSGPLFDWWKLAMLNTNPPVHTRLRSLASRAFTPRAANATRERMRALTVEHLREFEGRDSIDLIDDVTESLPLAIVCDIIGVPRNDHNAFHEWVADIGLMFSNSIPGGWQSQEWPHRRSMSQRSCHETKRNKIMRLKKKPRPWLEAHLGLQPEPDAPNVTGQKAHKGLE